MFVQLNKINELGYAYIKNFLSDEELQLLVNGMNKARDENRLNLETDPRYYNKSKGGYIPELKSILNKKTPEIKELFNLKNIVPESSYARFYYNDCTLNPHFDRPGLDYTLSVTLFSNITNPWPLSCVDRQCNVESFDIAVKDGALIYGTKMVHWRKPLKCNENQYVLQAFFHWKNV